MKTLTIFTPAYNRKHTIDRTYQSLLRQTCKDVEWLIIDDGSTDGTKDWVQSLGSGEWVEGCAYDWMGRRINEKDQYYVVDVPFADGDGLLHITYIYKPNGGLYTGYNVAYDHIQTELCVCIDSDDFAPDDMVDKVVTLWKKHYPEGSINHKLSTINHIEIGGIAGLDYDVTNDQPLGGLFPVDNQVEWIQNLHHAADSKFVFRTAEIKRYAPQIGFEGEKDFNPHYMQMQLFDKLPMLVVNKNFCWVEYQIGADSMSQAIFKQYKRSPKSYARYRLMEMSMTKGVPLKRKFQLVAHYVSACIFSHDGDWLKNSKDKCLVLLAIPLGVCYNLLIRYKASK